MTNKHALFKKVRNHLLKQNCRAGDGEDSNLYRAPDGSRCAIGCLIADSAYFPALENLPVTDTAVLTALYLSGVDAKYHLKLLKELQRVHDKVPVKNWRGALSSVAKKFQIQY